ncbi:MAG: hypothetical protein ACLPUT_07270 [Solirubrobacteraceae bacterium]
MRREEFEHVVAAAAEVTGQDEFVVIGSQAILGSHPQPPESMLQSLEADIRREIPPRVASTRTAVAWCLEAHDLVLSKCAAGRERDWDYAAEALKAEIVAADVLLARVPDLPLNDELRDHIDRMLRGVIASL